MLETKILFLQTEEVLRIVELHRLTPNN